MSQESAELTTNLTINDLKVIASLIEACSIKGVFRASELSLVGGVYDKLASIVSSVKENK